MVSPGKGSLGDWMTISVLVLPITIIFPDINGMVLGVMAKIIVFKNLVSAL
jgi:hypothetical protein